MGAQDDRMRVLISTLQRLCTGTASQRDVHLFVRAAQSLSAAHLRLLERKGRHLRQSKRDLEYDLLAADCIAEFFQQSAPQQFPKLTAYFTPYFSAGRPDEEIYSALIRLVIRLTHQQAIRYFRQRDPEGARIRRNILQAAKKNTDMILKRDIAGWYILSSLSPSGTLCQPDRSLLMALLEQLLPTHRQTGPLLSALISELELHCRRPVWVGVADIVHAIRQHRQAAGPLPEVVQPVEVPDHAAYARLIDQTLKRIRRQAIEKYIRSGKLTLAEGLALYEALVARSRSLMQEQAPESDHALILAHWPPAMPMPHPRRIDAIFDYMVRIFRRIMSEKIIDNF